MDPKKQPQLSVFRKMISLVVDYIKNFNSSNNFLSKMVKGNSTKLLINSGIVLFIILCIFGIFIYFYVVRQSLANDINNTDLLNFEVGSKYSDLCGVSETECPSFEFVNGIIEERFNNDDNYASINLDLASSKRFSITVGSKLINVAIIPYDWIWASTGYGVYVVDVNQKKSIANIINDKDLLQSIEVSDGKILLKLESWEQANIVYLKSCSFNDDLKNKEIECEIVDSI
ncbi:MAG: hypothetical protein COX77_00635 [Candidatus Komeilibacteria bacterium CG_4_10_14_0_2_um_filter_37_10]|uniref:Uncharacterized protein n=1 Tax=Candidatus Komeilibacteria bacterium CG_4_10_14_0_2_um_filter_37_10 TaxID=1974470 RepID=A0A2M7VGG8_9BACT|nr:MAG: hypothetical protein COX77_00635 [Candidatus Komeilibacteria bacterium CG_4_10_14_0_2_um_filter_37_10]